MAGAWWRGVCGAWGVGVWCVVVVGCLAGCAGYWPAQRSPPPAPTAQGQALSSGASPALPALQAALQQPHARPPTPPPPPQALLGHAGPGANALFGGTAGALDIPLFAAPGGGGRPVRINLQVSGTAGQLSPAR
jgi:hypothetical protein